MAEILPLTTIDEVINYSGPSAGVLFYLNQVPDYSAPTSKTLLDPGTDYAEVSWKTLVCHDMMGGYTDDRFCAGTTNKEAYKFFEWSGVDSFVYFSHNFVTIPPCGWVSAGHRNTSLVLGTLITEGTGGETIWNELLSDPVLLQNFIDQLVNITDDYRFDGWLINVENAIQIDQIDTLIGFVNTLTTQLKARIPQAIVVWYDAVTVSGTVDYQNELNDNNSPFFDVCDGIFLNYWWDTTNLANTASYVDPARIQDVYVGNDVFGRNTFGGGGYNLPVAMNEIRNFSLSAALFAQGWVYETFGTDNIYTNEDKLWIRMASYLAYSGIPFPFSSSFCLGFGNEVYTDGVLETEGTWFNLMEQQPQPVYQQLVDVNMCSLTSVQTNCVYNGGSSISFWMADQITIGLFRCNILAENLTSMTFTFDFNGNYTAVNIVLDVQTAGTVKKLYCVTEPKNKKEAEEKISKIKNDISRSEKKMIEQGKPSEDKVNKTPTNTQRFFNKFGKEVERKRHNPINALFKANKFVKKVDILKKIPPTKKTRSGNWETSIFTFENLNPGDVVRGINLDVTGFGTIYLGSLSVE